MKVDDAELAQIVSGVTGTLCDLAFVPGESGDRGESMCGRLLMVRLRGLRPINVVLSCDSHAARRLAAAMCRCDAAAVTAEDVETSLRTLLELVAAQTAKAMQLPAVLGEVRRVTLGELTAAGLDGLRDAVLLRTQGRIDLCVWIYEQVEAAEAADRDLPVVSVRKLAGLIRRVARR